MLSDPKRRDSYDRTGEIDEMPADTEQAEAMMALASKFGAIVGDPSNDPRYVQAREDHEDDGPGGLAGESQGRDLGGRHEAEGPASSSSPSA